MIRELEALPEEPSQRLLDVAPNSVRRDVSEFLRPRTLLFVVVGYRIEATVDVGLKGTAALSPAPRKAELPRFFYRLSARAQRTYLKGDAIERLDLVPGPAAFSLTAALMRALEFGAPSPVERAAQALVSELCRLLSVRSVRVEVRSVRPRNAISELHGIFYPRGPGRRATAATARGIATAQRPTDPLIVLWMRTAQRHDVVKPKTLLRTLMHELCHYLDYALLKLEDSFHNSGFFKRESFLVRTLYRTEPGA
jgi:hypothetical protein